MPITAVSELQALEGEDRDGGGPSCAAERRTANNEALRVRRGLLAHIHNVGENGTVLVVDVWRDQAAMDAFTERLRPVLGEDIADQINVRVFDTNDW